LFLYFFVYKKFISFAYSLFFGVFLIFNSKKMPLVILVITCAQPFLSVDGSQKMYDLFPVFSQKQAFANFFPSF